MSGNKRRVLGAILVGIAFLCIFTIGILWKYTTGLPRWILWENKTVCDASGVYKIVIEDQSILVLYDDDKIWTLSEDIKVQDALFCDVDGDQTQELVVLCWKIGRYGQHRPFWVEEDEKTWSQHIFIYECEGAKIRPKWMSSYIGQEVTDIAADKKTATQRQNCLLLTDLDGTVSVWMWDSWGFTRQKDQETSLYGQEK